MTSNVDDAVTILRNAYFNGFTDEKGPYKITRAQLGEILEVGRTSKVTLAKLQAALRSGGLILFPLDSEDLSKAKAWMLARVVGFEQQPEIDASVLRAALKRAKARGSSSGE